MVIVVVVMGTLAGSAQASIIDTDPLVYWTKDGSVGTTRPTGAGWTVFTTPQEFSYGETIWFAMDNDWDPEKYKTGFFNISLFTQDAAFFNDAAKYDATFGYDYDLTDPLAEPSKPTSIKTLDWYPSPRALNVEFTITPQCSWEWVSVTHTDATQYYNQLTKTWTTMRTITNVDGNSWCTATPEPSLGLLLLVGMIPVAIGFRRRRRS